MQWTHAQASHGLDGMDQIGMAQIGGTVSIIAGVAGTTHTSSGVRLCVYVSCRICMVTRVVTFLLAAWLLMRIVIPVCATEMTSHVLELLLEHKIHLPGSRTKFQPGKYLLCCSRAVPLQGSGVAWLGWHNSGRRGSNRRHGLNHCWSCRNHASSGVQLCVHVSTCTIARSGMFLPAAWLLKRIMIPVCAADMTSQVPRLLLKHQIMHPPESQAKF